MQSVRRSRSQRLKDCDLPVFCFLSTDTNENLQQLIRFRMNCERRAALRSEMDSEEQKTGGSLCVRFSIFDFRFSIFDFLLESLIENRDFSYFPRIGLDSEKVSKRCRYFQLSLLPDCENIQTLKIYEEFRNLPELFFPG